MKAVGKLPKDQQGEARKPLDEAGRQLREREREFSESTAAAQAERDAAWSRIPNLTHPDSPRGHCDEDHRELHQWGERRDFEAEGFVPKDQLEIAEALHLVVQEGVENCDDGDDDDNDACKNDCTLPGEDQIWSGMFNGGQNSNALCPGWNTFRMDIANANDVYSKVTISGRPSRSPARSRRTRSAPVAHSGLASRGLL